MKKALLSIVTATLLACGSAAAAETASPADCAPGMSGPAVPGGAAHALGAACSPARPGLLQANQNFLSDKELERALKMQLRGRLIDAKLNPARAEYTVLWEEQEGGRRKLRKLIVDAKTGKVKREIRGSS